MTTEAPVKWSWEADYLQACSCDYGCPCEFEAPPSRGFCEGAGVWRINSGRYGDVSLDGLHMGFFVRFPAAMHLGSGTLGLYIDEKASAAQRNALLAIGSGKAGGLPFEVFPARVTNFLEPRYVRFEVQMNGTNSQANIGDEVRLAFEPIKNPVTGDAEQIRLDRGTGFIFKSADVVSAKECQVNGSALNFTWPDKAGFVARVNYGN